ncbi:hypothetical protein ACFW1A_34485 [Kitasatospora sp. NPDC058965]|uniref:hypothetical protein n=1 Tax=Kitasatospora sp. NPDC058965 TaxID=3346682 RepID=UPI0036CAF91C
MSQPQTPAPTDIGLRVPKLTTAQAAVAAWVLGIAFAGLMAVLGWIAWRVQSPDLSTFTKNLSVVAAAFFGAVINPRTDGTAPGAPKKGLVAGWAWVALTVVGLLGSAAAALAVCWHGSHPNSVPALTAAAAAFAGLFVDTTGLTHSD